MHEQTHLGVGIVPVRPDPRLGSALAGGRRTGTTRTTKDVVPEVSIDLDRLVIVSRRILLVALGLADL